MSQGAGRRDASESAIVGALVKAGCDIEYGFRKPWDILVGRANQTFMLEIKTGSGKMTEAQLEFQKRWRGHYRVCRTVEEALRCVGL